MDNQRVTGDKDQAWFVYLLQCADSTTYIGVTTDVRRRLKEHNQGSGARYTRGRRPVSLLGTIACATRGDALRHEWRLKKLGPQARRQAFAAE